MKTGALPIRSNLLLLKQTNFFKTSTEETSQRQRLRLRNLFSQLLLLHLQSALDHHSPLSTYHLPLYLQRASPSNPARLEEQQEQIAAEEEAARANQLWEAHQDAELREALSKIQRLEESQQASLTLPVTLLA